MDITKCKNELCQNALDKDKKGEFCSTKCRSKYHSTYGVLEGDKLVKVTAMTRVIYPQEILNEINNRVGRINAGISNSGDLMMLSVAIDYMKAQIKAQSKAS